MEFSFLLKKLISSFLMPLSFSLILFLIGLFFLFFNSYKKAKIFLSLSFILLILFSNSTFSNKLLEPLEKSYEKVSINEKAKYILLLGGDYEARVNEAIRLYYLNKGSKIITSGYKGNQIESEASINAKKLISFGIDSNDIIIQEKPKDTDEEAKEIKKIIKEEKLFLVTSSYHMKRAMKIFKQEGLNVIAAPTDYLIKKDHTFSIPRARYMRKTEVSMHEYLGILWINIKNLNNSK